jgi:hypothetical protein
VATEERASYSGLMFWKILINRSTQGSMPMIATPEGRNVWILGDGGGSRQNVQYFHQEYEKAHYSFMNLSLGFVLSFFLRKTKIRIKGH